MMDDPKTCDTIGDLELILINEDEKPHPMSYQLLADITNNFSNDRVIAKGGSAVVYKGFIGNRTVAVKKLSIADYKLNIFDREVISLVKTTNHKNVIRCLGYCSNAKGYAIKHQDKVVIAHEDSRLLCFPYLRKRSLDNYITDASCGLEWSQRYQIIYGVCQGLHRLHQGDIVHMDLKPGNILLDDDMIPKIADFGISRCLDDENESKVTTKSRRGTLGYMAPEFIHTGAVTNRCDLYSLGVIIMEILVGAKHQDVGEVLESWINRLGESRTSAQLDQIKECARLGIECSNENPDRRPPNIGHIINRLDETVSVQETQESGNLLHVQPAVLLFEFQPWKLIPCTLKLTNNTDKHVAFKLSTAESVDWLAHFMKRLPVYGTVRARSTYTLILTVLEEQDVPDKRFCDLILQSRTFADDDTTRVFSDKLGYEDFFRNNNTTENNVKVTNEVKLVAFLSHKEGRSVSEPTGTGFRV